MNATVARLAWRALFTGRRGVLLVLMPLVLVAFAFIVQVLVDGAGGYDTVVQTLGYTLVLPLVALLATTGVLASEIEDGSILFILSTPVSRYRVAVSKAAVAALTTIGFAAVPLVVCGLVLDPGDPLRSLAWGLGAAVAGVTYCAVFTFLGTLLRASVIAGLLYVLVWESTLGQLLVGIRRFSVAAWGREIAEAAGGGSVVGLQGVSLAYAVIASIVVTVGLVWWAGHRLRSFSMATET